MWNKASRVLPMAIVLSLPLATPLSTLQPAVMPRVLNSPARPVAAAACKAQPLRGNAGCRRRSSDVQMFGPAGGGGFLGVGTPEMVVIGAVAWALLGPKELYRLAQQAGEFLGEWQQLGRQAQSTFKDALESEMGTDLMSKAKEAGNEATSVAKKMQDDLRKELEQTDMRSKVKNLADMADDKPAATPKTTQLPTSMDWEAPSMDELTKTLGDPETNRKTFAEQVSGATNERVMAMSDDEEFLSTQIAEAENQLAMLRTEAKVLELRRKQQETNMARKVEKELATTKPTNDVPKEL